MIEQVYILMIIGIVLISLNLINLANLIRLSFRNSNEFASDQYLTLINSLNQAIQDYKITFFDPRVKVLYQSYDLDPESQTRADQKFKEQYDEYVNHCCRDILRNYISKEQKRVADKFFTGDSLSLYVFSKLEGNS